MPNAYSHISKINFDTCTLCNFGCSFCSNGDSRTLRATLKTDAFVRVMENVLEYVSPGVLGLSAKGEPLLNSSLPAIISTAKQRFGFSHVYISTNGSLASLELCRRLLDAGLDTLKFSINAFDNESHQRLHGNDSFQRVIDNLRQALLLKAPDGNVCVNISSVTDLNLHEVKTKLLDLLGEAYHSINDISIYPITFSPSLESDGRLLESYTPCPYLFNEVYIDANCELTACCKDYFGHLRFGNLLYTPFSLAWSCDEFETLRAMHVARAIPIDHLCHRCLSFSWKQG